jgi:hypothetical protein
MSVKATKSAAGRDAGQKDLHKELIITYKYHLAPARRWPGESY